MIDFLIKAIIFIVLLGGIILVHEGGHLIIGKKNGIAVNEFAMGLGPRIFAKKIGGTIYSLRLLPFGGACIFKGEFEEESMSPEVFTNAGVFGRIATVAAGPIANFLLAFFLSFFIIGSIGYDPPVISGVMDGYPAQEAGLQAGDRIISIGGTNIVVYRDISAYTMFFEGSQANVVYERDGKRYSTVITPRYNSEMNRYLFGISGSIGRVKANPLEVVRYSLHELHYWIDISYKSLGMIFQGRITKDDVAGPVGIANVVGETYDSAKEDGAFYVWLNMVNLAVLISANLGVMNLLPLPALDGGRLVFLFIEAIRKKRVDPEKEAMVHFAGIVVLLVLMILIMFNDIGKMFR